MPPYKSNRHSSSSAQNQGELDDNRQLTTQLFSYWRIPLVTSFYLLITPFRIRLIDTENCHVDVYTCFIQKIFWGIVNLANICLSFAEIGLYWRNTHGHPEEQQYATLKFNQTLPDVYDLIDTVCLTIHISSVYVFLLATWKRRLKLGKLLEMLVDAAQKLGMRSQNVLCKRTILIITILTFLKPIFQIIRCVEAANGDGKLSLWLAINESVILRLDPSVPVLPLAFTAVLTYVQYNFFDFTDALCLLTVLLMGLYVNAFVERLENGKLTAYQIFHLHHVLKQASRAINKMTEIVFVGFLIGSITYYPSSILKLLESDLYSDKIFSFLNLIYHGLIWGCAAYYNGKMKKLDKWLSQNYLALKSHDLQIFIYDISKNEVGIHPFKSLLVNYGFCRSLITIVITYTIVLVQFRHQPKAT